ncbi:MAG: hypothetical protein HKN20_13855, partial [Gemmatimonadetes bacterium]|nr:hypothetical protein [Gemmatimonadota bacterium]
MQANERQNAVRGGAAGTLAATFLIGLIGALWEWRRALRSDPFHYADTVSIVSALLFALALFLVPALLVWFLAGVVKRRALAPPLTAVSFLFLAWLADFSGRGISVRSA